ncbi:uncharacterized protein BYT42DRAFT_585981 [Radiomyces spectabilis]|uniref:uncharacterized protein n=1 Tax=Radiomyces spectabilis TaxID=64574 RepID=UPI002220CF48|nr:uncharacterized protein BYT42DRAFT_585981 [Radiomyces spectabilis]KAI8368265.1 hypothetical protein BYT42DRAFT_585981 [Radiomyces spectabilis]
MPAAHISHSPAMPSFKKVVLYTGNVMRTSVAGRNANVHKKSNKELYTAIDDTLKTSISATTTPSYRYYSDEELLEIPDLRFSSVIPEDCRGDVEVTAKLFYLNRVYPASHIDQAIEHLQKILAVKSIDTFIVSTADQQLEDIKEAWQSLENHVQNGTVKALGVSDYSHAQLEAFLNHEEIKVKPTIDQINVAHCCNLPTDLIDLAKRNQVELLHNGDSLDMLSDEELTSLFRSHNVIDSEKTLKPRWVVKYHVFVKCRSVVADKGYIVLGDSA